MIRREFNIYYLKEPFTNALMRGGKRATAQNIFEGAFLLLRQKGFRPIRILVRAINKSAPLITVVGKKRGRTKIMVPIPIESEKRLAFAIKWIVSGARMRTESSMVERLAYELLSLSKGQGNAIRKKVALHKLAHKNRNNTYMLR